MTPTSLFELLKNSQKDFDPELVENYKRVDARTKKKYLILEWK